MAKYWTLAEIRSKIQRDTDTEAEDFIQSGELTDLINEAIDDAESEIHTLGVEDNYFLSIKSYDLTQGVNELALPDDIYAHKIRSIMVTKQDLIYSMKRFRGALWAETIANAEHYTNTGDYYKYFMVNVNDDSGATPAPVLRIVPEFRETVPGAIRMYYIRQANRLAVDTDICDIPEFVHFIIKSVKYWIYFKEGHPLAQGAKGEMEQSRQSMVNTLQTMIPDQDSTIVPDLTAYNEMT